MYLPQMEKHPQMIQQKIAAMLVRLRDLEGDGRLPTFLIALADIRMLTAKRRRNEEEQVPDQATMLIQIRHGQEDLISNSSCDALKKVEAPYTMSATARWESDALIEAFTDVHFLTTATTKALMTRITIARDIWNADDIVTLDEITLPVELANSGEDVSGTIVDAS